MVHYVGLDVSLKQTMRRACPYRGENSGPGKDIAES
jgi:hypothetical protein